MAHPWVDQLRFVRGEWLRAFDGINDDEGFKRFGPINSLGWMMGHLAWHENICWNVRGQDVNPAPQLHDMVGNGKPASTPRLGEMLEAWRLVTRTADAYLDALDNDKMLGYWERNGKRHMESIGTSVQRVCYHYFFHIGESQAVRQLLGHTNLPSFVGMFEGAAAFRAR
jgi:hypothetical protein